MKKILSIIVIILIFFCCMGVQSIKIQKHNQNTQFLSGDFLRFILVDNLLRIYQIHIPREFENDASIPIVLVLHGIPGAAYQVKFVSKMNEKADDEGFIVVYPNGHFSKELFRAVVAPFVWNEWVVHDDVDDGNFLRLLIEKLQINYNINSSRIHICGISGGASMSYKFGASNTDFIASIASIAGTIGVNMNGNSYDISDSDGPLSVMIFHGINDNLVPYNGGWAQGIYWKSVNESVSFWVENNDCDPNPLIETSESGNIIKESYSDGTDNSEVVLYTIKNGGHEWFGSPFYQPCEISATDLIWDFFESHPKQ